MDLGLMTKVGPQALADGAIAAMRSTRSGAAVVQSDLIEAIERGEIFSCSSQSGVASQAGLSGTTPVLTLYNPAGSGKKLTLLYAGIVQSVAPAAAAVTWIGLHQTSPAAKAVSAIGTLSTFTRNAKIGASLQGGVGQALLACTASTPIAVRTLGVLFAGALTVNNQQPPVGGWLEVPLVLLPDTAASPQTSSASGAAGLFTDFIWRETDL